MNADLTTPTDRTLFDRLFLKETFAFETPTPLEDCVQKLHHLHSDVPSSRVSDRTPSRYRVEVSKSNSDRRYFTVTRLDRTRAYDANISSTSRTLEINGTLSANPQTGGTQVTGQVQLPTLIAASFGFVVVLLLATLASGLIEPLIALIVAGMFVYLAYGIIQDRSKLLQRLKAL